MGPVLVAIASVGQKAEQRLVKQLIAQPAVEGFDEPVLLFCCGLCWRDVLPRSVSGKRQQNAVVAPHQAGCPLKRGPRTAGASVISGYQGLEAHPGLRVSGSL